MLMEGMGVNSPGNDYTYNGKELNEDFGLNLYDYGARWYDAALGRWWSVDPLGEVTPAWTVYNYVQNTPLNAIDPDGNSCRGCGPNGEDYSPPASDNTYSSQWPPSGGSKGDKHTDTNGTFVHDGNNWIDQGSGNRVLNVVDITSSKTEDEEINTQPKYKTAIPEGNGTNWLLRSSIATQSADYSRDPSALYRFSNEMPEYFSTTLGALFAVEGVVELGVWGVGQATGGAAAKGGVNAVEQVAVHGNSLKSLKPTWGYKLFSNDGTFLKNGITNKLIPEARYTKAFMLDKKMVPFKQFPNRLGAYQWEFQQNQILRGSLNLNMH